MSCTSSAASSAVSRRATSRPVAVAFLAGDAVGAPKVRVRWKSSTKSAGTSWTYGAAEWRLRAGGDMNDAITIRTMVSTATPTASRWCRHRGGQRADEETARCSRSRCVAARAQIAWEGAVIKPVLRSAAGRTTQLTRTSCRRSSCSAPRCSRTATMRITIEQARALPPTHLHFTGSGTPHVAGVSMDMTAAFAGYISVLVRTLGTSHRRSVRRGSRARWRAHVQGPAGASRCERRVCWCRSRWQWSLRCADREARDAAIEIESWSCTGKARSWACVRWQAER